MTPFSKPLVTQPMLQRQPNHTELRLIDYGIQILLRFQICSWEFLHRPLLKKFFFQNHYWGGTVDELFAYIFGIYIKFGYKNPAILTPSDSVDVAT